MKLAKIELESLRKNRIEGHGIRKKIAVSLSAIVFLTLLLVYIIIFVDPEKSWAKPVFFVFVFADFYYIFSVLLIKKRRGFLVASFLTAALIFRYAGANIFYYAGALIACILTELFFIIRKR